MRRFIVFALAGLVAQLVDGSLGMGYGVTSTSLLLTAGLGPAVASASVHLAEIGTTLASGTAHTRFGNVDWPIVLRISLPGAVGAFIGATALTSLATTAAVPWTAGLLVVLGLYILLRFTFRSPQFTVTRRPGLRSLAPLGLIAGLVDSTGGGGWGPIASTSLISSGRLEPRKVIGSVDTAEFSVTLAASIGFVVGLAGTQFDWLLVGALFAGGLVAAPVAAWLVRLLPAGILGAAVGGIVVVTNLRLLLGAFGASGVLVGLAYLVAMLAWATALTLATRRFLRDRAVPAAEDDVLAGAASESASGR